jgi:magnesium-transporting ATPase (P-type)
MAAVCLYMFTLIEVFPCFFLSCKSNARVKPTKTGDGPHSSYFRVLFMYSLFIVVLCIVCVYMCTVLLPPGGYPIAVNKYIISYSAFRFCQSLCMRVSNDRQKVPDRCFVITCTGYIENA